MTVLEPEVTILNEPRVRMKKIAQIVPWHRGLARVVDYALFFPLLLLCRWFYKFNSYVPFELILWIPIEAALITYLGTTPGKWLLGIKLQGRFDFMGALRRSVSVWLRGLGLGMPFFAAFSLFTAYQRLQLLRQTSWDRDENITVTHAPIKKWRVQLAVFVAAAGLLYYYSEKRDLVQDARLVRSVNEHSIEEIVSA